MACPNGTIKIITDTIETEDGKKKKVLDKWIYNLGGSQAGAVRRPVGVGGRKQAAAAHSLRGRPRAAAPPRCAGAQATEEVVVERLGARVRHGWRTPHDIQLERQRQRGSAACCVP